MIEKETTATTKTALQMATVAPTAEAEVTKTKTITEVAMKIEDSEGVVMAQLMGLTVLTKSTRKTRMEGMEATGKMATAAQMVTAIMTDVEEMETVPMI